VAGRATGRYATTWYIPHKHSGLQDRAHTRIPGAEGDDWRRRRYGRDSTTFGLHSRPEPQGEHKHFQDGQAFINAGGYRGPQLETLQPGEYYVNKRLFVVTLYSVTVVPPGYVAVIISSVGKELAISPVAPSISVTPDLNQPVHESVESLLITDKNPARHIQGPNRSRNLQPQHDRLQG